MVMNMRVLRKVPGRFKTLYPSFDIFVVYLLVNLFPMFINRLSTSEGLRSFLVFLCITSSDFYIIVAHCIIVVQ